MSQGKDDAQVVGKDVGLGARPLVVDIEHEIEGEADPEGGHLALAQHRKRFRRGKERNPDATRRHWQAKKGSKK